MIYPTISEYVESILLAEDNFDKLSSLRPVLDAKGRLVMSSGNFAVVFKMKDEESGKFYAIKCFIKDQEGREENYQKISGELANVQSSYLCNISYLPKELFVETLNSPDTEFPVLKMEWVEGVPLDKYVRSHLYDLAMLTYNFCRMAAWLMTQPFAHGDLKPDNILVKTDGTMTLVDYDGMYVPAMTGEKAHEMGSPDYRHPLRTQDDFNEWMDDFALASIALSLKAISLDTNLFGKYGTADHLLFTSADYRDLSKSEVIKALQPLMVDTELNRLYGLFLLAHSQKDLTSVSFRLFNLQRPDKADYIVEEISTVATEEDFKDAIKDEYGFIYSKDGKKLLKAENSNCSEYVIKEGTRVICNKAFSSCSSLQSVTIPESVTSIGDRAFSSCSSLQSVTFGLNNHHFQEARELIATGGGFEIIDSNDFEQLMNSFSNDKKRIEKAGKAARNYVEGHSGATNAIMKSVF